MLGNLSESEACQLRLSSSTRLHLLTKNFPASNRPFTLNSSPLSFVLFSYRFGFSMGNIELDIIVVGAGIAGLAAAVGLSRAGHNVTVSDVSAPEES
jgi:FAD dependent oxidoreductase